MLAAPAARPAAARCRGPSSALEPRLHRLAAGPAPQLPHAAVAGGGAPPPPAAPAPRRPQRPRAAAAGGGGGAPGAPPAAPAGAPLPVPVAPSDQVDQAAAAVAAAWAAGARRQRVEFVLPLIGATDLDDWPGGVRQQFKAAAPMVEALLQKVRALPGLGGALAPRLIDAADAVAVWESPALACVVFPTGESLKEVRAAAEARPDGLTLLVNAQWAGGQVVSDFGLLPWTRAANEALAASFELAYAYEATRIGGDEVRYLYAYGRGHQVNAYASSTEAPCVLRGRARPAYREVEAALRSLDWTMSSKGLIERARAEAAFIKGSADAGPRRGGGRQ